MPRNRGRADNCRASLQGCALKKRPLFVLHTTNLSPFGQRAKLALRVKGKLEDTRFVDTPGGTAALGALAPMAQIPVLEHGDFVLPESQAIVDYIDALCPDPALVPEDPQLAAQARLIARITDLYIAPHIIGLIVAMRPDTPRSIVASSLAGMQKGLGFAFHYVSHGRFSVGISLSVADLALAPFVFLAPRLADWHSSPMTEHAGRANAFLANMATIPHMRDAFAEMEKAYKERSNRLETAK